jgi:hypothetical protein
MLIKAEAIGVNFVDTYFRSGPYPHELPATADGVGAYAEFCVPPTRRSRTVPPIGGEYPPASPDRRKYRRAASRSPSRNTGRARFASYLVGNGAHGFHADDLLPRTHHRHGGAPAIRHAVARGSALCRRRSSAAAWLRFRRRPASRQTSRQFLGQDRGSATRQTRRPHPPPPGRRSVLQEIENARTARFVAAGLADASLAGPG